MRTRQWVLICGLLSVAGIAGAVEPPDSVLNPVTGHIESVYQGWAGSSWNVFHANKAGGEPYVVVLESAPVSGLAPRIAVDSGGHSGVVWWEDGTVEEVWYTERDPVSGEWTASSRVSASAENSRFPEIVADGADFWVVFEHDASGGDIGITVSSISDGPEPYPTLLATTSYGGTRDAGIESASGHVWTTWVDSAVEVGWSEYDAVSDSWSAPQYESYAADDVAAARARIRSDVIGG